MSRRSCTTEPTSGLKDAFHPAAALHPSSWHPLHMAVQWKTQSGPLLVTANWTPSSAGSPDRLETSGDRCRRRWFHVKQSNKSKARAQVVRECRPRRIRERPQRPHGRWRLPIAGLNLIICHDALDLRGLSIQVAPRESWPPSAVNAHLYGDPPAVGPDHNSARAWRRPAPARRRDLGTPEARGVHGWFHVKQHERRRGGPAGPPLQLQQGDGITPAGSPRAGSARRRRNRSTSRRLRRRRARPCARTGSWRRARRQPRTP